jgi:hypothetical protein
MTTVTTKFKYPDHLYAEAKKIGMHRAENNRKLDERKPEYKRPDEYDINGALGELIFFYYLDTENISYIPNEMYGDKPLPEYDVIVGNRLIDVKCVQKQTKKFAVNCKAHNKVEKKITHYVFVKLHPNNECDIYGCMKEDITFWKKETRSWTPHYFKSI